MSFEKKEAHRILDLARIGFEVPDTAITWALVTLGDMVPTHA